MGQGDEKGQGDSGEELKRPLVEMRRPYTPTQKEIDEHTPLHIPYRSWCPHCVAGKGGSGHHRTDSAKEKLGTTISLDYCFMTPIGEV